MQKILLSSIFALCAIAAQAQDEVSSVATFEETPLEAESHWFGDTDPEDLYAGVVYDFYSGRYMLTGTRHSSSWWSGFALSNETSTEYTDLTHQFRSAAGGAHSGSNYAVYYHSVWDDEARITNIYDEAGAQVSGMYVTNAAYALNIILNGDAYGSTPFATGDYFKMIITGFDIEENVTGTVDFYLADYRSENEADHYALDTWKWCDLSSLGAVSMLHITFETSQNNKYGALTPLYVCIDDINYDGDTGVAAIAAPAAKIAAMGKNVTITAEAAGYTAEVFSTAGTLVASQRGCNGVTTLDLSELQPGIYIVRAAGAAQRVVIR